MFKIIISPYLTASYDQIGLLVPRRAASGYRRYGPAEVDRLQQILFYRELDVGLDEIGRILSDPSYDALTALQRYRAELLHRRERLSLLIKNVDKTILSRKGECTMSNEEKFTAFKSTLIKDNEAAYGTEIRAKYGDETVDKSNDKLMGLSAEDYDRMQETAAAISRKLEQAVLEGADPAGTSGQEIAALHKEWLGFTWPQYSPEAHAGLVGMYVEDERFTAYYDKNVKGCAEFLRRAVLAYLGK